MGDNERMRLVIQIPCLNEEDSLPVTLAALPRQVAGFDDVLWLVIDDGSVDETARVAKECGVDHVVQFTQNKGLAVGFQAGLDAALKLGADVIVNTDADNQYQAGDIVKLTAPIVAGEADFVVGCRDISNHQEFSATKKRLQRLGSWVVRQASGTEIPDATSGFRAYSREAALQVNVVSSFTYTLETVIQAGKGRIGVSHVGIGTNPTMRDSRLFTSKRQYIRRSAATITRVYAMYEPMRVFSMLALISAVISAVLFGRFGYFVLTDDGGGHVQSLIVGAVAAIFALQLFMMGLLADLLKVNRVIGERVLRRVRGLELAVGVEPTRPVGSRTRADDADREDAAAAV